MKHKVTFEVEFENSDHSSFKSWVSRMASRWQANVVHEIDGSVIQQFCNGEATDGESESSLQQWIVDEYTKINQEYAKGWQEVGELLNSKGSDSNYNSKHTNKNTA